jgi:hypothetical protein
LGDVFAKIFNDNHEISSTIGRRWLLVDEGYIPDKQIGALAFYERRSLEGSDDNQKESKNNPDNGRRARHAALVAANLPLQIGYLFICCVTGWSGIACIICGGWGLRLIAIGLLIGFSAVIAFLFGHPLSPFRFVYLIALPVCTVLGAPQHPLIAVSNMSGLVFRCFPGRVTSIYRTEREVIARPNWRALENQERSPTVRPSPAGEQCFSPRKQDYDPRGTP